MTGVTAGAIGFIGAGSAIAGFAFAAFFRAGFFFLAALRAGFLFFAAFFLVDFFFAAFFLDFFATRFLDDFFFAFFADFFFAAFFFAAMFNSFQCWTDRCRAAYRVARTTKLRFASNAVGEAILCATPWKTLVSSMTIWCDSRHFGVGATPMWLASTLLSHPALAQPRSRRRSRAKREGICSRARTSIASPRSTITSQGRGRVL